MVRSFIRSASALNITETIERVTGLKSLGNHVAIVYQTASKLNALLLDTSSSQRILNLSLLPVVVDFFFSFLFIGKCVRFLALQILPLFRMRSLYCAILHLRFNSSRRLCQCLFYFSCACECVLCSLFKPFPSNRFPGPPHCDPHCTFASSVTDVLVSTLYSVHISNARIRNTQML